MDCCASFVEFRGKQLLPVRIVAGLGVCLVPVVTVYGGSGVGERYIRKSVGMCAVQGVDYGGGLLAQRTT
jgi:hypothetical protein